MATENNITNPSLYLQNSNEVKKVFNSFDKNRDGRISSSELVHVIKSLDPTTTDTEITRMMSEIDIDKDGFISLSEFTSFISSGNKSGDNSGESELRDAFSLYDENKNGLISALELHGILNRLGERCTVEECGMMISTVDSDGDGHVNFEEFKKMMSNNVATNGSGK